jgi:nucleotide-binding universal stress UspA family protein
MPFKRILCAVDFSRDSVEGFHVAVELARAQSAYLHVLHVSEAQPVVSEWLPIGGLGEVAIQIEEKASAAMESLVRSAKKSLTGLAVTPEVTTGRAFVEIVNRATELKADLIVLGSKGAASLEDIIVGSTAERVMKTAGCSVLIARPLHRNARDNKGE